MSVMAAPISWPFQAPPPPSSSSWGLVIRVLVKRLSGTVKNAAALLTKRNVRVISSLKSTSVLFLRHSRHHAGWGAEPSRTFSPFVLVTQTRRGQWVHEYRRRITSRWFNRIIQSFTNKSLRLKWLDSTSFFIFLIPIKMLSRLECIHARLTVAEFEYTEDAASLTWAAGWRGRSLQGWEGFEPSTAPDSHVDRLNARKGCQVGSS